MKELKLLYRGDGVFFVAVYHPRWSWTWSFVVRLEKDWRFFWIRTHTYKRGLFGAFQIGPLFVVRQPTVRIERGAA